MSTKFTISDIRIETLFAGGMDAAAEGVRHKKILKTLSIVQALEGSYEIKLGNGKTFSTGEGGVFIAPSDVTQEIVHHNGANGRMCAQWLFIDAVVNGQYRFDGIFEFPVLLDGRYSGEMADLIGCIRRSENYFERMRAAYRVLEILYGEGQKRTSADPVKTALETFVRENYAEDLKAADIAAHLYCSLAQVFRYTKKYYGFSPANYVNSIRLQQAEEYLRNTDRSVTDIAFSVGFSDGAYFSKLFKKFYADSPTEYRKKHSFELLK